MKHIEAFSSEEEIQILWKESQGLKFVDEEGRRIFIAHPGIKSKTGPDFKDAVIFVDDIKIEGDVECHLKSSDWFAHKHDENPEFSSVKIHVVWKKDCEVNGITISFENISLLNYEKKYLCEKIDDEKKKRKEIFSLGKIRILRKSERIKERISEINDERQAVYEFLAEALGYERARNFMLHIARKYPLSYVERIDEKSFTDVVLSEIKNFGLRFRGRPKNYPLQRIRALYHLSKKDFISVARKLFESRAEYREWEKNLTVEGLGKGRLRTVVANVFIPYFLYLYDKEKVFDYFKNFPGEEENRLIRNAKKILGIKSYNIIEGQGLIEIFKLRCSKFLCFACNLRE